MKAIFLEEYVKKAKNRRVHLSIINLNIKVNGKMVIFLQEKPQI